MVRTLFWEPWDHWEPTIDYLIDNNVIELLVWVGANQRATHHIHDFDHLKFEGHTAYRGSNWAAYFGKYQHLCTFYDMISRNYNQVDQRHYNLRTIHEYLNAFNLLTDYCCSLLLDNKIELLIISRMPHTGADYLMYLSAKYLGIPVIMFEQTRFPNRFFYLNSIEDLGYFDECVESTSFDYRFSLDEFQWSNLKDISYVKDFGLKYLEKGDPSGNVDLDHIVEILLGDSQFDVFQRINALFNYVSSKQFEMLQAQHTIEEADIDQNKPYVYFPLHYQPELNTSIQGGIFCDQLLAIERLSQMIPDDWSIYVKENPVQEEFMRGELFYRRFAQIKNARLVSREVSTDSLINASQFVATVTGTAGWEGICVGKKALVFGNAWYIKLPGVFNYNKGVLLEEILEYQIDRGRLENAVTDLLRVSYPGVIDHVWERWVKGFSKEDNLQLINKSIAEIIGHTMSRAKAENKKVLRPTGYATKE